MGKFIYILIVVPFFICGCATTNLQVETKPTNSIFLDSIKRIEKTVYLEAKNSSGKDIGTFEKQLKNKLSSKGYSVVQDAKSAQYILMTNVLFATNMKEGINSGTATGGTMLGAATGALNTNSGNGLLVGALAGAVVGVVASSIAQDEYYRFITDVVIREKDINIPSIAAEKDAKYTQYSMRIFSQATKMNLKTEEAVPVMVEQTIDQIVQIF
jgi:outer membrane lipoprotein SlyB